MSLFLSNLIGGGAEGSVALLAFIIILGTFLLEDTTTVIVGMLAADGILGIPLALSSLYAGIVLGDIGLYFLGYLASTNSRLARYVDHDFIAPFRAWLESRFVLTVFSARFIPGSRLPTYTASGFFRSPLSTFILTAILATSIWTTFLFTVSYWFGNLTAGWLGHARWGIAGAFLIALFFIGRHNLLAYRAKKEELGIGAEHFEPAIDRLQ
ncbi:MAG: VTT domain-containing protein [Candidatus Parcubacteria bacterium]|nr:VTT domain-containing protein [Candidatus Parcubacteria bacterium]